MTSVLGKLICKELGREKYNNYFRSLNKRRSPEVFCDIYSELRQRDSQSLDDMLDRLLETVNLSVRIHKRFGFAVAYYLIMVAIMYLILPLNFVFLLATGAATVCFLYKIVEFLLNRYCDRDIRIILIYKSVLFHLLEESGKDCETLS